MTRMTLRHIRWERLALGGLLLAAFAGLSKTVHGYDIFFHGPFTNSLPGELRFFLASIVLLAPGMFLVASAWTYPFSFSWSLSKQRTAGLIFIVASIAAILGHRFVLQNYPITDDEIMARFGGRVLASGRLMIEVPAMQDPFHHQFLHVRDGLMTSWDWPGLLVFWAFALKTGLGDMAYGLTAGAFYAIGFLTLAELFTGRWLAFASLMLLASPMAASLSLTTHGHLLSRLCVAGMTYFFVKAQRAPRYAYWLGFGLCLGLGFTMRPVEVAFFFLPFLGLLLSQAWRRQPNAWNHIKGLMIGAQAPIVLFAFYNFYLTGNPFMQARFVGEKGQGQLEHLWDAAFWAQRFGANLSHNLFMLLIWFFGIFGMIGLLGAISLRGTVRVLGLAVLSTFLVALLHDEFGLHLVGPIHYSEAILPLAIVATAGWQHLWQRWRWEGEQESQLFRGLCVGMLGFSLVFSSMYWYALHMQTNSQKIYYDAIHEQMATIKAQTSDSDPKFVVLSPPLRYLWMQNPNTKTWGGFVYDWEMPWPDLSDELSILIEVPGAEEYVKKNYPQHHMLRIAVQKEAPYYRFETLQ